MGWCVRVRLDASVEIAVELGEGVLWKLERDEARVRWEWRVTAVLSSDLMRAGRIDDCVSMWLCLRDGISIGI